MQIENKKAYHNYFIEDTVECGLALKGNEVKSIRSGMCSIKEAWCTIQNGNLVIRGMHITKWSTANMFDIDEDRERQLLAHKKEIRNMFNKLQQDGITLMPLKIYFKDGRAKVLVGICRGKHNYDKRATLKERQVNREIDRAMKGSLRS